MTMDLETLKPYLPLTLKSSLTYGIGMGLSAIINALLFTGADLSHIGAAIPARFLLAGVAVALLIVAVGSGVGGAIGTLPLPLPPDLAKSQWSKAWRGGLSMGLVFSNVMFVLGLALSLFSFYGVAEETESIRFSVYFAVAGVIFGVLYGLLFGLLMVHKHGVRYVVLASALGFGIGGFGAGDGIRRFLMTVELVDLSTGNRFWLVLGYVFFGLVGGAAMGFVFSYLSQKPMVPRRTKWWQWAIGGVVMLVIFLFLRPIFAAAADMLTPSDANLALVLDADTMGTHWLNTSHLSEAAAFSGALPQPVVAANAAGQLGVVWSQIANNSADVQWRPGQWDADGRFAMWRDAVNVSHSDADSDGPQAVVDSAGMTHIVWQEETAVRYSQCQGENCSTAVTISEAPACAASTTGHTAPVMAIDDNNTLMVAWQTDNGRLLYRIWPANELPTSGANCVPLGEGVTATQLQITSGGNGRFALAYVAGEEIEGDIHTITYANGQWEPPTPAAGNGRWPAVYLDEQNGLHLAWCAGKEVRYAAQDTPQTVSDLFCASRPALAADSQGTLHLVWYGDEVVSPEGTIRPHNILYESLLTGQGWTQPAIVSPTGIETQPSLTAVTGDSLHMVWGYAADGRAHIAYAPFAPYSCNDFPLNGISQIAYDVASRPEYHSATDSIPYCQNQYRQLVFMPNPNPAFSDQPPSLNGGFDVFAELAQTAEYEVLFSTMWYEADQNQDSPGYVLAEAIAALYQKLKANPKQYPRGLTIRILLGNPPELAVKEFSGQLFSVLSDLRVAGVDKMVDPDIGWRVQVANFDGAMPHSHTKVMIVDGKTILAAGFNMQYEHYAPDHPSGLGRGRQDLGMLVTGPVAQDSQRMYDDLWSGSDQRTCDFYPFYGVWQASCQESEAVVDHVPEVLRYYLPGSSDAVFSMYRSKDHDEADRIVEASLMAAQHTVDAMHVMFAMDMECDLNILFDLCDFGQATEYLNGLMAAAENGAQIRLILKPQPTDGIESSVAYDIFTQELERRGIRDRVEIRFFKEPIHYKTTLIDDEFLIVGSQNFHYSAFGTGEGLTEYSLGTDSPQAVADFKRLFAYQWEQAEKR